MLGKSQAGKTALIQDIKTYANPSSTVDRSLLGDGTFSKTDQPRSFRFKSNLPIYETYGRKTGIATMLIHQEASTKDRENHDDHLFAHETAVGRRLKAQGSSKPLPRAVEFKCLDTPGFCNNKGEDSAHAERIIRAMVAVRSFNLVLIVVNPHDPITADYQLALQYYSEVLYDLHSNIAFDFTHVDYAHFRRNSSEGHLALEEKTRLLSHIFQSTSKRSHEPTITLSSIPTQKSDLSLSA